MLLSRESLWNASPLLLSNLVLVNVNVITKSIEVTSKHQGCIHKRAWIDKLTFLFDFHLLEIEYETSIEDLESQSALATEDKNFIVGDLIRQAHVSWNPLRLINLRSLDLLPNILGDIIALDSVNDIFLVDSTSKCKQKVVFESAESNT